MNLGANNPEIQELLDKTFSSILLEQQKINKVTPSQEDKKEELNNIVDDYANYRGRELFFKYISSGRGHGPFTELVDGSIKYDLINGIGFNLLGHSHPIFIKSALEAATVDTLMVGNLQPSVHPYRLSKRIIESVAGSKLKYFWFAAASGSFAGDTALKILWQKKEKFKLIAFEKAFAGRSIATQNITYNKAYREGQPDSIEVYHVPHYDINDPDNSLAKTIKALDDLWNDHGDQFCAICIEIVQGEGGFVVGPRDYYVGIFEWAKKKGIYVWADEVQSFGRTKELFAFQMYQLEEYVDIVTVAKALQCAGVLYSEELNPKPGLIAGTFNGSITSINAGHKVLEYLTKGNFYGKGGRIEEIETAFHSNIKRLAEGSCKGKLGKSVGVGTMFAFEVGDCSKDTTMAFIRKLFDNGIISFSCGKDPYRVRFLLPLCLTPEHIEDIFNIIEKTVLEVIQ